MIFKLEKFIVESNKSGITLRCPECRQLGTFDAINNEVIKIPLPESVCLGHRRCPNRTCRAHVFVAWDKGNKTLVSYPPERICQRECNNYPLWETKIYPPSKKGVANESGKHNFPSNGIYGRKGHDQTRIMA